MQLSEGFHFSVYEDDMLLYKDITHNDALDYKGTLTPLHGSLTHQFLLSPHNFDHYGTLYQN